MLDIALHNRIIDLVSKEAEQSLKKIIGDDLKQIILFGSCARGDYKADSDIDIAILTNSDRIESKRYSSDLVSLATELAMKYFSVVNFVCIPYKEFQERKSWYLFFMNISKEGKVLYG